MSQSTVSHLLSEASTRIKQVLETLDADLREHNLSIGDVRISTDKKYLIGQRTPDQIFYVVIGSELRT